MKFRYAGVRICPPCVSSPRCLPGRFPGAGAESELIQNTASRHGLSLNGRWRAIVDPYESGYFDYRYKPQSDGGFGANKKPKSKSDLIEYDFDTADRLQVPGDWNTQRPELMFYEGTVWYKREFDCPTPAGHRIFVWFGAANYRAMVFVNGVRWASTRAASRPSSSKSPTDVHDKGNVIVVKVDDQRRQEFIPTVMTDWWNYGGLTRSVRIIDVPGTFVQDYSIQLEKGSQTHRRRMGPPQRRRPMQNVTVRIPEAGIAQTFTPDANGLARVAFDAQLDLWSPERPKLYAVTIESGGDRVPDRIGFRSIEAKGRSLLLNGKPVFLRGVSIHAEAPFHAGRVYSEADARTLLQWAKDVHCNFVRLPHYPHDEVMTRLADEMGLLVWSEIPVYWTISWENAETLRSAEQQLTEMISRDKNRASVILWSVANETPRGDARLKFLTTLVERARSLDGTRLITAALETHYADPRTIVVEDPLGKFLDVVSCNEYVGWYDGLPDKIDTITWQTPYEKPFILSEFGADAQADRHGDDLTRFTEEYQANVYRRQVAMFRRIPFLNGTIAWVLVDFRSPRRPLAGIQDFYNRKGLFSDRGERKSAFFILRDYYKSMESK